MRAGHFLGGVVVGAIVSTLVLTAATAFAGTGIGSVFNLGRANSVNATSTLSGSSPKTLQLVNSGKGPALGLHVREGQPPLSTDSSTKVTNLNADMVDGLHSSAFELSSNTVRLNADPLFGQGDSWDIGPFFTFGVSCTDTGGVVEFDQTFLNNSPTTGGWWASNLKANNSGQVTTNVDSGTIGSGLETVVVEEQNPPPPSTLFGSRSFVNLIWVDGSETITATFAASTTAYVNACQIVGTITRST